jgi:hypothetical protein
MVSSDVLSDPEVRAFVSEEFLRIGRYTNPAFVKTSKEIMTEADSVSAHAPPISNFGFSDVDPDKIQRRSCFDLQYRGHRSLDG